VSVLRDIQKPMPSRELRSFGITRGPIWLC